MTLSRARSSCIGLTTCASVAGDHGSARTNLRATDCHRRSVREAKVPPLRPVNCMRLLGVRPAPTDSPPCLDGRATRGYEKPYAAAARSGVGWLRGCRRSSETGPTGLDAPAWRRDLEAALTENIDSLPVHLTTAHQLQAIEPARGLSYVPLIAIGDQWPRGAPRGPACRLHARVRCQARADPRPAWLQPPPNTRLREALRGGSVTWCGVASGVPPLSGSPASRAR